MKQIGSELVDRSVDHLHEMNDREFSNDARLATFQADCQIGDIKKLLKLYQLYKRLRFVTILTNLITQREARAINGQRIVLEKISLLKSSTILMLLDQYWPKSHLSRPVY